MATIKGGDKLEAYLKDLAKKVGKKTTLKVGFLEGATYPDGTPVAMVAAIQDFGAPGAGIPPRPFFRNMVRDKSPEWGPALAQALVTTNYDTQRAMVFMGEGIAGQLRQSIVDTNSPPLSEVTLQLRKMKLDNPGLVVTGKTVGEAAARVAAGESSDGVSTKPLVEPGGGVLLGSVDYKITI